MVLYCSRHLKHLTGVDLSHVSRWIRFMEVHYHRPRAHDGTPEHEEVSVVWVPDVVQIQPTIEEVSTYVD